MASMPETIVDAIASSATIAGDKAFAAESADMFRDNADTVSGLLSPNDAAAFAQLMFIVDGGANRPGFLAVLEDRLVLAWTYGLFSKKRKSAVIAYRDISSLDLGVAGASLGGNPALTIGSHGTSWTFALPPKDTGLAKAVHEYIAARIAPTA